MLTNKEKEEKIEKQILAMSDEKKREYIHIALGIENDLEDRAWYISYCISMSEMLNGSKTTTANYCGKLGEVINIAKLFNKEKEVKDAIKKGEQDAKKNEYKVKKEAKMRMLKNMIQKA